MRVVGTGLGAWAGTGGRAVGSGLEGDEVPEFCSQVRKAINRPIDKPATSICQFESVFFFVWRRVAPLRLGLGLDLVFLVVAIGGF